MRIALVQFESRKGEIQYNLKRHLECVKIAVREGADLIVFPELSLSGYEPSIAADCSMHLLDERLHSVEAVAGEKNICVALGMPLLSDSLPFIGMAFIQKGMAVQSYAKQLLHEDEYPYFKAGNKEFMLHAAESNISFGICYESIQETHLDKAISAGADVYIASVAKPAEATVMAHDYFVERSKGLDIPLLFCNGIGPSDNFISAGRSAVWKKGDCLLALSAGMEGILFFDTENDHCHALHL